MTDRTKKKVPKNILWPNFEANAFKDLKSLLCKSPTLHSLRIEKSFTIYCDASSYGIGACLSQRDDEVKLRPISFSSQKFTTVQQNWSTIKREAYAVVLAVKKFKS